MVVRTRSQSPHCSTEAAYLSESACYQRGAPVAAYAESVAEAGSYGNDILDRASDFNAQNI